MPKRTYTVDLHNHTPLCNHAEGSIDDYIQAAIDRGIDIFGFSDHAPMEFDPKYRMGFAQMREYEAAVQSAAKRYQDRIQIRLGYEVDWLPGYMDDRVLRAEVDYLIGSVHFIDKWGFDNPEFIGRYEGADLKGIWKEYFDLVAKMAKSGLFDIVGHLDLIKVFKFIPDCDIGELAAPALDAVAEADMTVEINAAGFRKPVGEAYPSQTLLKMAFERGIPVTFGSDAHTPEQVGYKQAEIHALAKAVGYTEAADFIRRKRVMHPF